MGKLYSDKSTSLLPLMASPVTCVRRRNGKLWGHITSIIIDPETHLPVSAMVLITATQIVQRVPWTVLIDSGDGYRLKVGLGELALMAAEKSNTECVLIWHDGMDWLIQKDQDEYRTAALDDDTWVLGPPPGMTEADLDWFFTSP